MRKGHQIGLVMALGLLTALVMGLTLLSGPASAQTTPIPTVTTTPLPTAVLTPTPAGCAAPLNLTAGTIIYVKAGVIIRSQPTVSSAFVGYTEQSTRYTITGGPVCNGDYNWWQVTGPGNPGWVAEGKPSGYFISDSGATITTTVTACEAPTSWSQGETILLYTGLRVRSEPGLQGLVLTVASEGTKAVVLDGPACVDGYNWWLVRLTVLDIIYDGWIAQGSRKSPPDSAWAVAESDLSKTVCNAPLPLQVGDRAYINYYDFKPKNLRTLPSLSATILYDLIDNVPVTIIGGPVCADGYNWWQVRVLSNIEAVGWVAQGGRWIRSIGNDDR